MNMPPGGSEGQLNRTVAGPLHALLDGAGYTHADSSARRDPAGLEIGVEEGAM